MSQVLLLLLLLSPPQKTDRDQAPPQTQEREIRIQQLIDEIAKSGRVLEIGETRFRLSDPRKEIAPGMPPVLAFRYFQGADRHRFGKLDLMLDDAGH